MPIETRKITPVCEVGSMRGTAINLRVHAPNELINCLALAHWHHEETYCILPCIMCTFLPQILREKEGCTLNMGTMITYHGHNNPIYNAQKNVGAHYIQQNMVVVTRAPNTTCAKKLGKF